jgi:hypothetical protein
MKVQQKQKAHLAVAVLSSVILSLASCGGHIPEPTRSYYKIVRTTELDLRWYRDNYFTNSRVDHITITVSGVVDTVCIAENIVDVNIYDQDSVVVKFVGNPQKYLEPAQVKSSVLGIVVHYDTTGVWPGDVRRPFRLSN